MDDIKAHKEWYAVRSTFTHKANSETKQPVIERRVFLYLVDTLENAVKLATIEGSIYMEDNEWITQVPGYDVFGLGHGSPDLDGREVWSFVSDT